MLRASLTLQLLHSNVSTTNIVLFNLVFFLFGLAFMFSYSVVYFRVIMVNSLRYKVELQTSIDMMVEILKFNLRLN